MENHDLKLLVTREPKPGENLMGYILALTELNGYDTPRWIMNEVGLGSKAISDRCWPAYSDGTGVDALSVLTGVDRSLLLPLYYRPVEQPDGRLSTTRNYFLGHQVNRFVIRGRQPKICPECLKEDRYIRGIWDLAPITACPIHKALLLDRCPACNKRISWTRHRVRICKCEVSWRKFKGRAVDESELDVSRHISRLCGFLPDESQSNNSPIYSISLAGFLTALFLVSSQYQAYFGWESGPRPGTALTGKYFTTSRTSEELHQILAKGFQAFKDWPRGYFDFLHWRRENGKRSSGTRGLGYYFGDFQHHLFLQSNNTELDFMREAYRQYAAEYWTPKRAVAPPKLTPQEIRDKGYMTKKAARDRLNIDVKFFDSLVRQQKLEIVVIRRARQLYRLVDEASVERLEQEVGRFLDQPAARTKLGVEMKGLLGLVKHGCLTPARRVTKGVNSWLFTETSVDGLLNDLRARVRKGSARCEIVSFDDALKQVSRPGCKLGPFVTAILNGEIVPCGMDETAGIRGLIFEVDEAASFTAACWRNRKGDLLYVSDAAKILGVKPSVAFFLRDKGFLPAKKVGGNVSPGHVVSKEAIEHFQKTYVQASEIADRFDTSVNRIARLLMESGVQPVTGPKVDGGLRYFFRRADVEALKWKKAA